MIKDVLQANGVTDERPLPTSMQVHLVVLRPGIYDRASELKMMHRHPERRNRWRAINALVDRTHQTSHGQSMSQGSSDDGSSICNSDSEDSGCGEEDDDSQLPRDASSLSWDDLEKRFHHVEDFQLQPKSAPLADIERLRTRLLGLRDVFGNIPLFENNSPTRLFFIAAILETACRVLGDVMMSVDEEVVVQGDHVHVPGRFEFVLSRGGDTKQQIFVVVAKSDGFQKAVGRLVTGLEAVADVQERDVTYGIVTNYYEWRFFVCQEDKILEHVCSMGSSNGIPPLNGLKNVVGKICGLIMLSNS